MSMEVKEFKTEGDVFVITVEIRKTFAELMQDAQLRGALPEKTQAKQAGKREFRSEVTGKSYKTMKACNAAEERYRKKMQTPDQITKETAEDREKAYVAVKRIQDIDDKIKKLEAQRNGENSKAAQRERPQDKAGA